MGNEMGNNNTAGLKEEGNATVEASENPLKESVRADDVKGENHVVPADGGKDFHEKVAGVASDEPEIEGDPHAEYQESGRKEQEEIEAHPPVEILKAEVESNEASAEESEIHSSSLPKDLEDHEKAIELNVDEIPLGGSDQQLEKHDYSKKAEKEDTISSTFDTMITLRDSIPQPPSDLKLDQHELDINADPSVQDGDGLLQESEDVLILTCANEENGHLLGPDISNDLIESLVSDTNSKVEKERDDMLGEETPSQEVKMSREEKFEIEDGDEVESCLSSLTTLTSETPSSVGKKCNGVLSPEVDSIRTDSLNSQPEPKDKSMVLIEVSEPEDKSMVLIEETKLIGSEPETEEKPHEYNPTQFCEEPVNESNEVNGSESEFRLIGNEIEDNETRSVVNTSSGFTSSKDCQTEEANVGENGYQVKECVSNQNMASDGRCKDLGEAEMVSQHEMVPVPGEFFVADHKCEEEQPEEKKIVEEIVDKAEASYATATGNATQGSETAKQCMPQQLTIEQVEAILSLSSASPIGPETNESTNESIPESKQEGCNEFFAAKTSTNLTEKTLGEDLSQYNETTLVTVAETENSAIQSCEQGVKGEVSAFASGTNHEAQESAAGRLSTESSPDNLNTQVQMRKSPSFDLDLRIKARDEESDQTPLLFQDNNAMGSNQNMASDGHCKDSGRAEVVSQHEMVPVPGELFVADHKCEEEQPEEKKIVEEIVDKAEASYATATGSETAKQCMPQPHTIEQVEAFLSLSPASTIGPETNESTNESIPESKQESCNELFAAETSTFNSTNLTAETKDSASGTYEAQESAAAGRLSTESSPDNLNTQVQMRKSPSFDLDLRIEARDEESDQTPLLFQDNNAMGSLSRQSADVSLQSPVFVSIGYVQDSLHYESMPGEKKVVTLERSDSEKSKTPFLGFLKEEEEEAHMVVTSQKQENHANGKKATKEMWNSSAKEAASTSPKDKEKRKTRSSLSLFGNCMCCATVIN